VAARCSSHDDDDDDDGRGACVWWWWWCLWCLWCLWWLLWLWPWLWSLNICWARLPICEAACSRSATTLACAWYSSTGLIGVGAAEGERGVLVGSGAEAEAEAALARRSTNDAVVVVG
jgi:hypothetical protein